MDSTLAGASTGAAPASTAAAWPLGEILRDVSRGGLAGALVGVVGAGIGGRIAMRLVALLVPSAAGKPTENGNVIGDITLEGTLSLVLLGLVLGLFVGVVWVVVSPWIPGTGLARAVVAMPVSVGLGTVSVIDADNPDFLILGRDPLVVAILVGLVALIGFAIALVDDWLDGRLPHPAGRLGVTSAYVALAIVGSLLVLPQVVVGFLGSTEPTIAGTGLALAAVGLATLAWWILRLRGTPIVPRALRIVGRAALLAAVALGFVATAAQVSGALRL